MRLHITAITLLASFLLGFSLQAQRIKDKPVNLKYIQLPEKKLPADYKTYSVNATGPLFSQAGTSTTAFANSIVMDGFKKLDGVGENAGHLRTKAYGGRVYVGQIQPKTRTVKTKDKEGVEKTSHYYYYEVPLKCNTNFRVYNPEGEVLANGDYANDDVLKTQEYSSTKARSENRGREVEKAEIKHSKNVVNGLRGRINAGLVKRFDYDKKDEKRYLYLVKKHASEDRWEKHYEEVKTILKDAKHNVNSAELKEQLTPAITFYEGHAEKDPRGDKKLKRIYKAANYNLGLLHYAIDEFDTAKAYLEKVIKSEERDRRSSNLIKSIGEWEGRMEKIGVSSMHYKRDLSDALPPAKMAALEAEKEEMEESTTTAEGSIFVGKDEMKGTWSLDKEAEDFIFGEGGNVKFIVQEEAEMKEIDLTNADISEFKIADRIFKKMRFVPSAKGETEASMQILEEVYSSDRIKLYKYYPSSGALSDDKTELAFQKSGQEFPISVESTMFLLWKKGLAKYFDDCADLAEMAAEGGFEKTKDDLIKAARVYSELCEEVIKP